MHANQSSQIQSTVCKADKSKNAVWINQNCLFFFHRRGYLIMSYLDSCFFGVFLTVSFVSFSPGLDIEAARKEEERIMLRDARQWLNSGQIQDTRHAKSGGTALHVAAAKGYVEVLK